MAHAQKNYYENSQVPVLVETVLKKKVSLKNILLCLNGLKNLTKYNVRPNSIFSNSCPECGSVL